jgi:hypothetical protein
VVDRTGRCDLGDPSVRDSFGGELADEAFGASDGYGAESRQDPEEAHRCATLPTARLGSEVVNPDSSDPAVAARQLLRSGFGRDRKRGRAVGARGRAKRDRRRSGRHASAFAAEPNCPHDARADGIE